MRCEDKNKSKISDFDCLRALTIHSVWAWTMKHVVSCAILVVMLSVAISNARASDADETARRLMQNYNESECSLLTVLHRGSGLVPRQDVPYWIGNSVFSRFSGTGTTNLFGVGPEHGNSYFDFCVDSLHQYVDGESLKSGYYLYEGVFAYTSTLGDEKKVHKFRELDAVTASLLGQMVSEKTAWRINREMNPSRMRRRCNCMLLNHSLPNIPTNVFGLVQPLR